MSDEINLRSELTNLTAEMEAHEQACVFLAGEARTVCAAIAAMIDKMHTHVPCAGSDLWDAPAHQVLDQLHLLRLYIVDLVNGADRMVAHCAAGCERLLRAQGRLHTSDASLLLDRGNHSLAGLRALFGELKVMQSSVVAVVVAYRKSVARTDSDLISEDAQRQAGDLFMRLRAPRMAPEQKR